VSAKRDRMRCPKCGAEMNHHSDKLLHPTSPEDAEHIDPVFGGLVEEFHTCPKCGASASRAVD